MSQNSCSLKVVSTKVGGIPEVLPDDLIYLTDPTVPHLIEGNYTLFITFVTFIAFKFISGLERAMIDLKHGKIVCPYECNIRIRNYYNWENISSRTEVVYNKVANESSKSLSQHLNR